MIHLKNALALLIFAALMLPVLSAAEQKSAKIPYRSETPVLDAEAEPLWDSIPAITDFSAPWGPGSPEPTSVKIFYNDAALYFFWTVTDSTPLFIEVQEVMDIVEEDRVEIFMEAAPQMAQYYGTEITPEGKSLDYSAVFFRKFDYTWRFPEAQIAAKRTDSGYAVELAYPLEVLRKLNVLKDDGTMRAGLYRADFYREGNDVLRRWMPWVDPQIDHAEFHIPDTLGVLQLEK